MSRAPTFEILKAFCRLARLRREATIEVDALVARRGRDAWLIASANGRDGSLSWADRVHWNFVEYRVRLCLGIPLAD